MANIAAGWKHLARICDAFGIDPKAQPVTRLVIDIPADGVVRVYVQRLATNAEMGALAEALGGPDVPKAIENCSTVGIDEKGIVSFERVD